jgi:hypothetical protein
MSDRAALFLFSLIMVIGGVAADAYLVVTNQIASVDGLFLFCSSCVIVVAFGLYLRWLIGSAVSEAGSQRSRGRATVETGRATNAKASAVLSNVH